MDEKTWHPTHTRRGLTIWTYRHSNSRVFATVKRDVDGLIVVRGHTLLAVRKGCVSDLYADFEATVTPELAARIRTLDLRKGLAHYDGDGLPFVKKLEAALLRHMIKG